MSNEISALRLKYFAIVWAIEAFFEQAANHQNTASPVVTFAIFLILCRPGSLIIFTFLLSAGFAYTFLFFDMIYLNNIMIEAFINFSVLLVLLFYILKHKRLGLGCGDIYLIFAPALRILIIGFYFFVSLAKVNSDFLDPRYSWASYFVDQIHLSHYSSVLTWFFGLSWVRTTAPWIAVISEGLFPILLFFRPTRELAVAWVFIFHFFIGLAPMDNVFVFSMLMLCTQFVFLSDGTVKRIHLGGKTCAVFINRFIPTPLVRYMMIGAFVYLFIPFLNLWHLSSVPFKLWVIVYSLIGFVFVAAAVIEKYHSPRVSAEYPSFRGYFISRPAFPSILAILFVLLVGVSPYLGEKIAGGFDVFSNVRILGHKPNHLIIPSSIIIFNKDLITVLRSNKSRFRRFIGGREFLTANGFRHFANKIKGKFSVRILYQGKKLILYKGKGEIVNQPLLRPPSWLENKFLYSYVIYDSDY